MTTTELDYLLTLELPTITLEGMSPVVRLSEVPKGLRSALDQYQFLAARPILDGEVCVWLHDWNRFLRHRILAVHAGMHVQSLQLGRDAPSAAELAKAPVLSNWLIIRLAGEARLVGTPTGHPTCCGPVMRSSPLCGLDPGGGWARTISRWYALANPVTRAQFMTLHGPSAMLALTDVISVDEAYAPFPAH